MSYTQSQWDREVGWGKVPKEYAHETKLEEYTRKINYNIWADVSNVKVTYNMKEFNDELQSHSSGTTTTNNRNNKS